MQQQARIFSYKAARYKYKINPFFVFLKEAISNPKEVGAGCPSSSYLANTMAKEIVSKSDDYILELGGGTGTITRALLQQGITSDRLIVIERSPTLVLLLRKKFPNVRVIQGDASQLDKLLGINFGKISAVVSSLPLRSLPKECVFNIKQQINKVLDKDGLFVQFTYDLRLPSSFQGQKFLSKNTQVVWRNLPPARVDTFIKAQTNTSI